LSRHVSETGGLIRGERRHKTVGVDELAAAVAQDNKPGVVEVYVRD
jgi:hypothetical protein